MDERTAEISELYTRILQLQRLQAMRMSADATDAIQHHVETLRKQLAELTAVRVVRTNA